MAKISEFHMMILEKGELDCKDIEDVFGDYVEGDLPESLRGRVDEHIESCEECLEFKDTYMQVIELAREIKKPEEKMPEDVRSRLHARLNKELGLNLA